MTHDESVAVAGSEAGTSPRWLLCGCHGMLFIPGWHIVTEKKEKKERERENDRVATKARAR